MATVTQTCTCGKESTFEVPDDHDGSAVVWECPMGAATGEMDTETGNRARTVGDGCGARNVIEATAPAAPAVEPELPEGHVRVGDGDDGTSGDVHVG